MPSFRFRGFADASTVALSVAQGGRSAEANLVWAQALAASDASFSIMRVDGIDDGELVAPFPAWFAPTDITGFVGFDGEPISEPAGDTNVYDPTALEIFWSWDFGDPGYVPLVTPNTPAAHRDTNRAFVKRPCHVFASPGGRTVTCYAYDSAGNWATAEFVFGPDGDSPAIADPDVFFAGDNTCYYSEDGIFPVPRPLGSVTASSASAVESYRNSKGGSAFTRILCRRGEVYVNAGNLGGGRNSSVYYSDYGNPADPPPKHVRTNGERGPFDARDGQYMIVTNQDWEGGYDAATETGRRTSPLSNLGIYVFKMVLHRVRVSGHSSLNHTAQPDILRVFSDCDVTNWQDYGVYGGDGSQQRLAIIGCDIHQKPDALTGTSHGVGNSNFANLTNRHGPIRHGTCRDVHIACSSFFSRNGWSNASSTAGTTTPPTTAQAAYRFGASGPLSIRNHTSVERSSFESGAASFDFVDLGAQVHSKDYQSNVLFESNLFVASTQNWSTMVSGKGRGMSARNNYWHVPAVQNTAGHRFAQLLRWRWEGDVEGQSRAAVFNNTALLVATDDQMNGAETRALASLDADHSPILENNIHHAPNLAAPIGPGLAPLGTDPLAGFTPRFLGNRWNFPPIGHPSMGDEITVGSVREGGVGDVGDGEWIALDYPDYTDKCRGVDPTGPLGQVTQAIVTGNSGQYHQVSVHDFGNKAMAPAAAGGNGRVEFDFTPEKIRIRNTSGESWPGSSKIWVLLDLRDHLMGFVPGTASPGSIPAPVPLQGSAAFGATQDGLWARTDFFGTVRSQPGTQGAMVAAN